MQDFAVKLCILGSFGVSRAPPGFWGLPLDRGPRVPARARDPDPGAQAPDPGSGARDLGRQVPGVREKDGNPPSSMGVH